MYNPPAFREERLDVLHQLIRQYPLGLLITAGGQGIIANPVPFLIRSEAGTHGTLWAHLAHANEQVEALRDGVEALVVFQGAQAFVTPSWYAAKAEHHKVVPTWNYVVVQARGTPRVIDDPEWLRRQIGELTQSQEGGRAEPWAVSDAPDDYITAQLRGIVGLEIPISAIDGKWKVSQNRSGRDREGVRDGLRADGAQDMADIIAAGLIGTTPDAG